MIRLSARTTTTLAAVLLAGCGLSPRPDPTVFLVLAPGAAQVAMPAIARQDLRLGVGPVAIPSYLDRVQYVTRVDATTLSVNEFARWSSPLPQLIEETIGQNLDAFLAPGDVLPFPWRRDDGPDYQVRIVLQHFEVTTADSAVLVGRWEIHDRSGATIAGPTPVRYHAPAAPDPQRGAWALSELLGLLSADIAGALRSMPAGT